MSTMYARMGMGYEPDEAKLGQPPQTILPIYFNFDIEQETQRVPKGKKWTPRNWSLIDTTDNTFDGTPKLYTDGRLRTDFLLITTFPNILTEKSKHDEMVHQIIAGCHGVGTKAIRHVLNSVDILEKIKNEKGNAEFFQTVIKIPEVEHTAETCHPLRVEYVKTIPLKRTLW